MASNTDAAAKLGQVIKPMLDDMKSAIIDHRDAGDTTIIEMLNRIDARLDVVEKLLAGSTKKVTREKKAETATTTTTTTTTAVKVPINKMAYFKGKYKEDAEYRPSFKLAEFETEMNGVPDIAKKTGAPKITAEANFIWSKISEDEKAKAGKYKELYERIEREFNELKAASAAANKPAQLTAETNTP